MKSRTILNIALFLAIVLSVFSLIGLLLNFVVRSDSVYVPVGKNYYKSTTEEDSKEKKESFYFGQNPKNMNANIFDAGARELAVADASSSAATDVTAEAPELSNEDYLYYVEHPEKCMLFSGVELTGTIVAKDASQSIAILKTGKGSSPKGDSSLIARIGSDVIDGAKLAFVWRNFAIFRTTSGIKCIGEGVGEGKATAEAAPAEKKLDQPASTPEDDAIRSVGPNQYVVSRDYLNKITGNLGALASQARIVPSPKDNGFKIFSISKNSIYSKIGIQNGDILKAINGIELSSPDKALEAYSRLQSASKLSLDIVRHGQNETMEYTIE